MGVVDSHEATQWIESADERIVRVKAEIASIEAEFPVTLVQQSDRPAGIDTEVIIVAMEAPGRIPGVA